MQKTLQSLFSPTIDCAAAKRWSKYTTPVKDSDLDYDVQVNLRHNILSLLRLKIVQPKVGFARLGYLSGILGACNLSKKKNRSK